MFLDSFVHLLDVQIDVLAVDQDSCFDGTFIDVFGIDDSFPPPFVQHDSNSVFVIVFPSIHENVIVLSPIVRPVHVSTSHSIESRPIVSFEFGYQFFDFFT